MKKSIIIIAAVLISSLSGLPVCAQPLTEVPDYSAYILTPPAPKAPRINSAKVFGATPGAPFFYCIAATGERPMTFEATGLPKGLKLDKQTGHITGRVKRAGTYQVKLYATNSFGRAERDITLKDLMSKV